MLEEHGVHPVSLDKLLGNSDFIFVVASVTTENNGFLDAKAFAKMKRGCAFILLSRLKGFLRSAHRAGALDSALTNWAI